MLCNNAGQLLLNVITKSRNGLWMCGTVIVTANLSLSLSLSLFLSLSLSLSLSQLLRAVSRGRSRETQGQGTWGFYIGQIMINCSYTLQWGHQMTLCVNVIINWVRTAPVYVDLHTVSLMTKMMMTSACHLALMCCVISVEQTSLTWPHFFSYSYYLVLYYFVFCSVLPKSTEMSVYVKR